MPYVASQMLKAYLPLSTFVALIVQHLEGDVVGY